MPAPSFIPELPVRVVPFTGYPMNRAAARLVTDWHVVDARGRTVRVFPQTQDWGVAKRRTRADRLAQTLNAMGDHARA